MLLRNLAHNIKSQNWAAALIELFIVIVGVFIGLQVNTWNEARVETERRELMVGALVAFLSDWRDVQEGSGNQIRYGLTSWEAAAANGERLPPFFFRMYGSDTAPKVWSTFEQMQLTDLFDPSTLMDLTFYFSELDGVGQKYIRYVTFVENQVLPGIISEQNVFYDLDGNLKPKFQANMNRLRDFQQLNLQLLKYTECLVYRLKARRSFDQSCVGADYQLDGMDSKSN